MATLTIPTSEITPMTETTDDNHRLMLVDDDEIFRRRLAKAMDARGFEVCQAGDAAEAVKVAKQQQPHYALLDQRMPGKSGLELIGDLAKLDPDMQIVLLTGYGSIAHAVEATRAGAIDYLTKPVDADQIVAAFERSRDVDKAARLAADETTPSLARVEWDYMQRILHDCGGNISQAARKLGIHRRSLQRKLAKYPPVD